MIKSFVLRVFLCFALLTSVAEAKVFWAHLPSGWYSRDKKTLQEDLKKYFSLAEKHFVVSVSSKSVKAIIAPHAGQRYSGICAASAYATIAGGFASKGNDTIKRVIILAPSHSHGFDGIALPDFSTYRTPLGDVSVDMAAVEKLKGEGFKVTPQAYPREHSMEMQLPFLQTCLKDFSIVPLIVGRVGDNRYDSLAQGLAKIVDDTTLIVVSSDFIHHGKSFDYTPFLKDVFYNVRKYDSKAIRAIADKSFDSFAKALSVTKATICGRSAIKILLKLIEKGSLGEVSSRLCSYYTSAQLKDARGGDEVDVEALFKVVSDSEMAHSVSYAGIVFTNESLAANKPKDRLTGYEKRALLAYARDVVAWRLGGGAGDVSLRYPVLSDGMMMRSGAFVTINTNNKLRGCIGHIVTEKPLYKTVASTAQSAAFEDGRFSPLSRDELGKVKFDISVLTPPRKVKSYKDIELGRHGIILTKGGRRAVYLAKVWGAFNNKLEPMLSSLSRKAGLKGDAWKQGCSFEVFEEFGFGE